MSELPPPIEQQVRQARAQTSELRFGFVLLVGGVIAVLLMLLARALGADPRFANAVALLVGLAVAAVLQRVVERHRPTWFHRSTRPGTRPSASLALHLTGDLW